VALNPAHNKPVAIAYTGTLLVPMENADAFRMNLGNWDKPLVSWNTISGKKGESVDAIAKRYGLSGAALRQVNSLKVDKKGRLLAAQPILVPGKGAPVTVASAPAKAPGGNAAAPAQAQAAKPAETRNQPAAKPPYYTVKSGDTLHGIARQFGKAVPDLLRLNNLTARASIQPGLRLRLQ